MFSKTANSTYLLLYNICQLSAWSTVLILLFLTKSAQSVLSIVRVVQTVAWIEVIHTAIGLAGGGVATAFVQSLGRYSVLEYVIVRVSEELQGHVIVFTLFASWALADVLRYAMYTTAMLKLQVKGLRWLRYSAFFILQPIGIGSEWFVYWISLEEVDERKLFQVVLPNEWNFAFNFGLWNRIVLVLYLYFGPMMVMHMIKQRRVKLQNG